MISEINPDEIYNLGAQSHVAVSFDSPEYTADVSGLGALRILEAIRFLNLENKTKFYQASSSELFGLVQETPQSEATPFYPRSPYGVAKLFAYWITVNYREAYGIYACNGLLFNHESPRRGETFVSRKITRALCNIANGLENILYLGNLDAKRDWGHAKDYVEMQWLMLQQKEPLDFVIATGIQHSVRDFLVIACKNLGIEIQFKGEGLNEVGIVKSIDNKLNLKVKKGSIIIKIDPVYFRPTEVESLLGDSSRAKDLLNWSPKVNFEELIKEMIDTDLQESKKNAFLLNSGYKI